MGSGLAQDAVYHRHEADVHVVLQADHVQRFCARRRRALCVTNHDGARRHQAFRLHFFAAQADHHHFAAKVRVQADVAHRANRDLCPRRIDRDAATIAVLQRHHVVHIGKQRQQLFLDLLHRMRHHAGHALHGAGDGQDIARADRAVGIAVAFKREGFLRWRCRHRAGAYGQCIQGRRDRHADDALVDPAAPGQGLECIADHHVVADNRLLLGQVHQGHLVALRHGIDQYQTIGQLRAGWQATVIDDDGHVVLGVDLDAAWGGDFRGRHRIQDALAYSD